MNASNTPSPREAQKAMLIVLDGFGIGKDSPFNAIRNAQMPFYRELIRRYPHSQILTHGENVGLPAGVMGNSEVGHMTLGSGRVIFQDLVRINKSIQDKSFFKNEVLRKTLQTGAQSTGQVHLLGLVSDGGVHSHMDHLLALLDLCIELEVPRVSVHAFLDGRDTPPRSGIRYIQKLLQHVAFQNHKKTRATLSSLCGRYWAMDRDKRWDRIDRAFHVLAGHAHAVVENPLQMIEASHQAGRTDEFLEPVLFSADGALRPGDSAVFFNFRADRARQLTQYLMDPRRIRLSALATFTEYDSQFALPVAFKPQKLKNIFPEILARHGLRQLHVAETEKYAHVTFFFNGGNEKPYPGEDRILIDSPRDVSTYDQKPEMSARQVADILAEKINSAAYHFIVVNFANADMVGHTGNYEATVQAMEALDQCLAKVIGAAESSGYHVLLTADHGNAEEMKDKHGEVHTQHTLNPVPAIWISPGSAAGPRRFKQALKDGTLADIIPSVCQMMNVPVPEEMTGLSLLPSGSS